MQLEGLLLVNKPLGLTSHDVVEVVRRKFGIRRVGHTGTLDPIAEGLLVILVGNATRLQRVFQAHDKVYEAVIQLGVQTDTADAEGRPVRTASIPTLEPAQVREVLASFEGSFSQTPPAYSAIKVRGRPAYWWARRQQPVTLSARNVQLSEITLVDCGEKTLKFRVRCSAGTYVRTLAEAISESLGTVGHLAHLIRLRVGTWNFEDARSLEWVNQVSPEELAKHLRSCDDLPD